MRYAFTFDASACTGCKTCQVACKDKNGLPAGVLWRRVYEVSGGTWQREGAAWTNTVFAYNVSVGCNHCDDPACASVCPTGAYTVRDDGIVVQDETKCVGCEYCAWACPYSAPQYSAGLGRTTKCDFCHDLIDDGLPPACVAACPMRALDLTQIGHEETVAPVVDALWNTPPANHPFPLPSVSKARPRLAIKPHRAMANGLPKAVANREEVRPAEASSRTRLGEAPLVAFTLCGQTAAGVAVLSLIAGLSRPLWTTIGMLLAVGALLSLLHLGTVSRAWRAPVRLKSSPLSREILMLALFGGAWLTALVAPLVGLLAMAAAGAGFVYTMGEVYRLEAVPGWNTWRTHAAFGSTSLVLGALVMLLVSALDATATSAPRLWLLMLTTTGAAAVAVMTRRRFYQRRDAKTM